MSLFYIFLKFIYCSDFKTNYVLVVGKILESKPALISIYLKISLEAEKLQKRTIYIDFLLKKTCTILVRKKWLLTIRFSLNNHMIKLWYCMYFVDYILLFCVVYFILYYYFGWSPLINF